MTNQNNFTAEALKAIEASHINNEIMLEYLGEYHPGQVDADNVRRAGELFVGWYQDAASVAAAIIDDGIVIVDVDLQAIPREWLNMQNIGTHLLYSFDWFECKNGGIAVFNYF